MTSPDRAWRIAERSVAAPLDRDGTGEPAPSPSISNPPYPCQRRSVTVLEPTTLPRVKTRWAALIVGSVLLAVGVFGRARGRDRRRGGHVPAFAGSGVVGLPRRVLGGAGIVLLAADAVRRRVTGEPYRFTGDRWRATVFGAGLAVVAGVAVAVPTHVGLTAMVPHGGHLVMVALLAIAVAVLLCGAQTAGGPLWTIAAVVLVCLPIPAAALVGLAPGFLMLISPLVAILFAVYAVLAAVAWRAGIPLWRTVAAGALVIARSDLMLPGRTRVRGLRLEATDGPFRAGAGPLVRGTTLDLVMATAGRRAYLDGLDGDGVEVLRRR